MKAWVLLAAVAAAGPAFAVPPVIPSPESRQVIQDFIHAITANDLPAYAGLFSPDAKITTETGAPVAKPQWMQAAAAEFTGSRQTRFLKVFAGPDRADGGNATRVLLVEEVRNCIPNMVECFPRYRSEAVTVQAGRIIGLERSMDFSNQLSPEGAPTFFGE